MDKIKRATKKVFQLILIKPSHYDDDGYVIQWVRSYMPSNTLATLYGLAQDCAERQVLGDDVEIRITAYDETNRRIRVDRIVKELHKSGGSGLVCLVGVQSNQYPRAVDLAKAFHDRNIQVCIGGFHVSGSLAMLPGVPAELQSAMNAGISLFAGELEEKRFDELLRAAQQRTLRPLYNYMSELPAIEGEPSPFLPASVVTRVTADRTSFDAGRGCPYLCSFCTIINVQGRKSRSRTADDVERIVRANAAQGIRSFFITDDNFARNQNWEAIFDRLIEIRERGELTTHLFIQVDTMCHKIPRFIEKAQRAGVKRVFIGFESINPETLKKARKGQNRITQYRALFQAWHNAGVLIFAGYIIGFPDDTPETIVRDIGIIQRELPVDMLEFFILTPLPGSQDHKELFEARVPMDPDLNNYDTEHVVTAHRNMSAEKLEQMYYKAWDLYYSPEHIATMMRRAKSWCGKPERIMRKALAFYACIKIEKLHPLEGGVLRRKYRRDRRPGMPRENPLTFYPQYFAGMLTKFAHLVWITLQFKRALRAVQKGSSGETDDIAMQPVSADDLDDFDLYTATEAAQISVDKIRRKRVAGSVSTQRAV
jgi:tRNA A37 methylthiotransferase MiaB